MKRIRRVIGFLMILTLIPALFGAVLTGSGGSVQAAGVKTHSGVSDQTDPTIEELTAMYAQFQTPQNRYAVMPSTSAPYSAGEVDAFYQEQTMSYLNFYRYVAKLPPLEDSEEKDNLAQHGAVLLASKKSMNNYQVEHYPSKPANMDNDFYQLGLKGTSWSTISGYNYRDRVNSGGWTWEQVEEHRREVMLPMSVKFQIRDYEPGDFRDVGHRRYLLSPYLNSVGFGMAETPDNYVGYYFFDLAVSDYVQYELNFAQSYDFTAWPPSGNCPNDMMEKVFPWSISLNENLYKIPFTFNQNGQRVADKSGIVITVTRTSDGKVWTFDENSPDGTGSNVNSRGWEEKDSFFTIDLNMYGYGPIMADSGNYYFAANALVFRPGFEDSTALEGVYKVRVTGLKYRDGSAAEISYSVNFFHLGHSWDDWKKLSDPTCTEPGVRKHTCTVCGLVETRETAPLGHDWGEWVELSAPGCVTPGKQSHSCARCGETVSEDIEPIGHNWGFWIVELEPTCTENGSEIRSCYRCGQAEQKDIDALGHAPGEPQQKNFTEPSCTEPGGYDMVVSCTRCGKPISSEHIEIEVLGHNWGAWEEITAPTCTEPGEGVRSCERCGETETGPLDALGHNWGEKEVITAPTCTEAGEYHFVCTRCGASMQEPVDALGHDWEEGLVTSQRTLEHAGERILSCRRCGVTETEVLPKLTDADNPFTDNKAGKFYYGPVLWAYYHIPQITSGLSETEFGPKNTCTRAQVVTFLWNAAGKPEPSITESPFVDTKPGKFYYKGLPRIRGQDRSHGRYGRQRERLSRLRAGDDLPGLAYPAGPPLSLPQHLPGPWRFHRPYPL